MMRKNLWRAGLIHEPVGPVYCSVDAGPAIS
jgi:hypothetical protein